MGSRWGPDLIPSRCCLTNGVPSFKARLQSPRHSYSSGECSNLPVRRPVVNLREGPAHEGGTLRFRKLVCDPERLDALFVGQQLHCPGPVGAPHASVEAFDRGANDYLTKSFSIEELAARVRVLLLRTHRLGVLIYLRNFQYRGLRVDFESGTILGDGYEVTLTPKEWSVLAVLVRNAGRVVTHRQILQEAWGPQYGDETDYVRAYIARLRRKLEPDRSNPRYILSERGIGYRLPVPE